MNKKIINTILLILIVTLSACSNDYDDEDYGDGITENVEISFDVIPVENVEELMYFSQYVIRGEVLDSRVEWRNDRATYEQLFQLFLSEGMSYDEIDEILFETDFEEEREPELMTIYRIHVIEVFHGTAITAGEIIELSRLGGELDNARWEVEFGVELEIGAEFALFLRSKAWRGVDEYTLAHTYEAAYYIPSVIESTSLGMALDSEELDIELESANHWYNDVVITLGDLIEIAHQYNDSFESN